MAGKIDLAAAVATKLDISKVQAEAVVVAVIEGISDITAAGDRLALRGFGSFVNKTSKQRSGRNPQTGEPIIIMPKTKLTFKAA